MKKYLLLSKIYLLLFLLIGTETKAQNGNHLDLTGNSYVEIYNFSSLMPFQTGTISFWFKINDINYSNTLFSMSDKTPVPDNNEFYIVYRTDYKLIQSVVIMNGTVVMNAWMPANSINDTNWHNYTLVSDNIGSIEIYLDGISQAIAVGYMGGGTINDYFFGDISGINNIKIGALERSTVLFSHSFAIDDLRIWNKALTPSEVASSINSSSTPPIFNLMLYYDFEQIENLNVGIAGVNDVLDETGNFQHGDILGGTITGKEDIIQKDNFKMNFYPNPFTSTTTFSLHLKESAEVSLKIVDVLGKEVRVLLKGNIPSGGSNLVFDRKEIPAGIYFYQLKINNSIKTGKIIIE